MPAPSTPRRRSSIVQFMASAKKTISQSYATTPAPSRTSAYHRANTVNLRPTPTQPTHVNQQSNKDAVKHAITNAFDPPRHPGQPATTVECLFISQINKLDHPYASQETDATTNSRQSTFETYANYFKEHKNRYVAIVRTTNRPLTALPPADPASPVLSPLSSPPAAAPFIGAAQFLYVVVLPSSNSTDLPSVEIRFIAPLHHLHRLLAPGDRHTAGNLELRFHEHSPCEFSATPQMLCGVNQNMYDSREAVVWNVMQIYDLLEGGKRKGGVILEGLEKEELDFASSVHGYLADNAALCALFEREDERTEEVDTEGVKVKSPGLARMQSSLFVNREEETDAEKVLNQLPWSTTSPDGLKILLQTRLTDLEANTCENLIAWEEKPTAGAPEAKTTPDTKQELIALIGTLDNLDDELAQMESWLTAKIATIKPLTDDCADIEKENNALEQTWRSYASLATELDRLLNGLAIEPALEAVLSDPLKRLNFKATNFYSDVDQKAVDDVVAAGAALREALDRAASGGGVHLSAVNERVETLLRLSSSFCKALSTATVTAFNDLGADLAAGMYNSSTSLHNYDSITAESAAKTLKDQQRQFESMALEFAPIVKTLASLKPETMYELRNAYSSAVAEGVFRKPLWKSYFKAIVDANQSDSLPANSFSDLKNYPSVSLKVTQSINSDNTIGLGGIKMRVANLEQALSTITPLMEREGFFTATMFGSTTGLDKFRFEALKKCVGTSCIWIDHYLNRLLALDPTDAAHRHHSSDEVIFDLVSAAKLQEAAIKLALDPEADSEVNAGKRMTAEVLINFKEACERQWREWVREQIDWIGTHASVPAGGKRAGVFASFAKFPSFVDRTLAAVNTEGADSETNLSSVPTLTFSLTQMADALLQSLRECASREGTDQQYASDVMLIENTYFFGESIRMRNPALATLFAPHLNVCDGLFKKSAHAYVKFMMKREFKGLFVLFQTIARIRKDVGDGDVPIHCPRATFIRTLSKEAGGDVLNERIREIRKRMEKHVSEESGVLSKLWSEVGVVFLADYLGFEKVAALLYNHKFDVGREELQRILRIAGGETIGRRRSGTAQQGNS